MENKPKPDNRDDNVEKLQEMVQHTIENIEASHDAMSFANEQEKQLIAEKNKRREASIEAMRSEIKDEYSHKKN